MSELTKKEQIQAIKNALRPLIKDVRMAEGVLLDAQTAAAPMIAKLIGTAGNPGPHKLRLDSETVVLFTFRKIGDVMIDGKSAPLYGLRETDLSDDDE